MFGLYWGYIGIMEINWKLLLRVKGLGFTKIRGTFLGSLLQGLIWGSTLGSPYFGKLPCRDL